MRQKTEEERRARLHDRLTHARKMVQEKVDAVKRGATLIGKWQKRVAYYERELSTTLEQKRALRVEAKRRKRLRKITI